MIDFDKDQEDANNSVPESARAAEKPMPEDHPGFKQIIKNENPRANENISEKNSGDESEASQVGTEITDGEDG